MLTSLHNPRVREVRALLDKRRAREEARRFVVEGVRLVETALQAGVPPEVAFFTADLADTPRGAALLTALQAGCETVAVSPPVLRAMSDTETPQGVVAVVPFPTADRRRGTADGEWSTEDEHPLPTPHSASSTTHHPLVLVIDGVRDPGNLGTLLRSAAAVGVDAALLAPGTVDLYNPKTVRAGMGAHFQVAALSADWDEIRTRLAGLATRVAAADAPQAYFDVDWTAPAALIVGGEAEGVSSAARAIASASVSIPMRPGVESLNAAMAATVILFEAVRQRLVRIS
ncbi:MAG: RNA methyltransferase [Anaerolineae bacterium]|nr:RNA methyltransferase [Anaerolineae bacterium]